MATTPGKEKIEKMFSTENKKSFCELARELNVSYALLDEDKEYGLNNGAFFDEHFSLVFERQNPRQFLYNIQLCYNKKLKNKK